MLEKGGEKTFPTKKWGKIAAAPRIASGRGEGARSRFDRRRYPDAIPGALTGALEQTRQLGDTALHPPGLYKIHMFVWFHVQIDLNGLQALGRSSGYPGLPLPVIASPEPD